MGVSEVYQAQYHIDDYNDLSYNWGNDAHPETYQSFVTTGKGLIDQSIFPFQRRRDAWSLGAYCTQFYCKDSQDHMPGMMKTENRNTKNNAFVTSFVTLAGSNLYSQHIIDYCKYSPNPTMGGYAPWINFCYNKFTIVPVFGVVNSSTGQYNTTDYTYNELVEHGMENWRVNSIVLEYYGAPSGWQYNPLTLQFAGNLYPEEWEPMGGNDYKLRMKNTMDNGVYYIELPTILFNGYSVTQNDIIVNRTAETITSFFDYSQMDIEMTRRSDGTYRFTISMADALKIMNSLGFYWGKSRSAANSEKGINCTDPDVVCPVIDSETHMVTETVLSGSEISDYAEEHIDDPFCNFLLDYGNLDENDDPIGYTTEQYRENYNPEQSTIEPADEIDLNEPVIATTGGTSVWLMNQSKLEEFFTYLWNPDGTIFDDIVKSVALFGENPMDSVISCRFFPLNLADVFNSKFDSNYRTIVFGRKATTVTARHMISSNVAIYDLGSFTFNDAGMFNDFRDYEPYSQYSLYLPFVGIVPLSAIECISASISIKYIIDLVTGACTAVIYTNGVPYKYVDGMIGIEVPVTGRNMAQYGQQILGAAMGGFAAGGMKGSKIGENLIEPGMDTSKEAFRKAGNNFANGVTGRGVMHVAGGAAAAVGAQLAPAVLGAAYGIAGAGIAGAASALLNNPSPQQAGSNVPAMGLAKPLYPYFIVQRSDSWIPENYAKLHGRPLQQGGKVGDFSGFSTFSNLKLENIPVATSEEKTLISKILASGVYI